MRLHVVRPPHALGLLALALGCSSNAAEDGGSDGTGGASVAGSGAGISGSAGQPGAGGTFPGGGAGMPASGSGGVPGGGSGGAGASAGAPSGGSSGLGGTTSTACTFQVTHSMSSVIPTVAVVEFSADLPAVDSATIEYGLDTSYGQTAPVDLAEPGYRTLLLGMKPSREYHFRIAATSGGQRCTSGDYSVMTGARPNGLPTPMVMTNAPEALAGGYLITARWGMNNDGPAFILDADGELVWWFPGEVDVIRARMTYDGKAMWIRNTAQTDGTGVVLRVSMDGTEVERWELPRTTHDLAVVPDGKLGLIAHTDGCDEIIEFDPATGMTTPIFNVEEAHGQTECHVNYLAYSATDDSYFISDWTSSAYVKISRSGELRWVLNGEGSTISGASWERQHGIHVLEPNRVLVFSNGAPGGNSPALEYRIDETSGTATELWRYDADVQAQFGGDIQRLENGNTLVTYSSAGVIHEVSPSGELLQSLSWPLSATVSYSEKRASLYGGPPPKIH